MTLVTPDWLLMAVTKALTLANGLAPLAMSVVAGVAMPVCVIDNGKLKLIWLTGIRISFLAVAVMPSTLAALTHRAKSLA